RRHRPRRRGAAPGRAVRGFDGRHLERLRQYADRGVTRYPVYPAGISPPRHRARSGDRRNDRRIIPDPLSLADIATGGRQLLRSAEWLARRGRSPGPVAAAPSPGRDGADLAELPGRVPAGPSDADALDGGPNRRLPRL